MTSPSLLPHQVRRFVVVAYCFSTKSNRIGPLRLFRHQTFITETSCLPQTVYNLSLSFSSPGQTFYKRNVMPFTNRMRPLPLLSVTRSDVSQIVCNLSFLFSSLGQTFCTVASCLPQFARDFSLSFSSPGQTFCNGNVLPSTNRMWLLPLFSSPGQTFCNGGVLPSTNCIWPLPLFFSTRSDVL